MINYKMILQYDGSRYSGWQVQGNTEQTIQGKLQSVLEKMTGEKAGRGRERPPRGKVSPPQLPENSQRPGSLALSW